MNWLEILLAITVLLSLAYGVDDLFVDGIYWVRLFYRKIKWRNTPSLDIDKMNSEVEQRIAILLPCWHENDVVGASLRNTLFTIQYSNYDVFVGVYPNDPETMHVVKELKETLPNVHYAVCPNPGPTSKADNLNSMVHEILKFEKDTGAHFDIFVIHDAEDVVHPLSMKLYNHLIPRKDMVQIPVFPLEVPLRMATHWTYADEFAENHTKDIMMREAIHGFVPSAGVGTALSRRAIESVALKGHEEEPFSTQTLTEDYAFSLRLNQLHMNSVFVHQSVVRIRQGRRWGIGPVVPKKKKEWIATRALFPVSYSASVRQKSRWILGISLQEWKESGWVGNAATRYTLLRDRKGPIGHLVCLLAYMFVIYFAAVFFSDRYGWNWKLPRITHNSPLIWTLLIMNMVFMLERLLQRCVAVWRIYGFEPAVYSMPRMIYGNIINAHAFIIALSKFWSSLKTGRKPVWSKTSNVFPTVEQLTPYRRKLGDLLLASAAVSPARLSDALKKVSHGEGRLGTILVREGFLTEEALLKFLGELYAMPVFNLDESGPDQKRLWQTLSDQERALLNENLLIPAGNIDGKILIAISDPSNERLKHNVEEVLGEHKVQFVVAPEKKIREALSSV